MMTFYATRIISMRKIQIYFVYTQNNLFLSFHKCFTKIADFKINRITLITEITKMNWGKLLGLSCISGGERVG